MFSDARSISDKYFVIRYQPNQLEVSRLGTAVSKKAVRTSIQRNRLKRIIRESFRHENLSGCDLVVTVRSAVVNADNRVLYQSLRKLWQELLSRCVN